MNTSIYLCKARFILRRNDVSFICSEYTYYISNLVLSKQSAFNIVTGAQQLNSVKINMYHLLLLFNQRAAPCLSFVCGAAARCFSANSGGTRPRKQINGARAKAGLHVCLSIVVLHSLIACLLTVCDVSHSQRWLKSDLRIFGCTRRSSR